MKPTRSQEPVIGSCPGPDESNPHPPSFFLKVHFNIVLEPLTLKDNEIRWLQLPVVSVYITPSNAFDIAKSGFAVLAFSWATSDTFCTVTL
jgi:hypothetical protein